MMSYTEQLEREAEQRRLHLSVSLDELRARLSPGQVVNQLVDYVQDGSGGQFFHNLKRQVISNPLPVTLIGAGVAWLVMARRHNGNGQHAPNRRVRSAAGLAADTVAEVRSDMSAKLGSATSSFSDGAAVARARLEEGRERLDDTVQSVRETAGETYSEVYNAATGAYERVSERATRTAGAMADSIRHLGRGTAQTGQSIAEFCRDQPLVVAGLGLAIGAALGAALPATELEDRVMGDASEDAKRKVSEIASDTVEKVQAVGERAIDAAREAAYEEAETQGFTAERADAVADADTAPADIAPAEPDRVSSQPYDEERRSG